MSAKYKSDFTKRGAATVKGDSNADLGVGGRDADDKPCPYGRTLQSQDNPSLSLSDPGDMIEGKEGLR